MQLSVLEREVGLTVTERHGRRLRLTPAGRLLAQHGAAAESTTSHSPQSAT